MTKRFCDMCGKELEESQGYSFKAVKVGKVYFLHRDVVSYEKEVYDLTNTVGTASRVSCTVMMSIKKQEGEKTMNEVSKKICDICRQKQKERNPDSVGCAFLHDNCYCDRIEDIDALIKKLLKMESEERKIFPEIVLPEGSAEFVDKVIAEAEQFLKESE